MSKAEQLYKNDATKTAISPIIDNPDESLLDNTVNGVKIKDKTISISKTKFIIEEKNLFNYELPRTVNRYYLPNGNTAPGTYCCLVNEIELQPNTKYYVSEMIKVAHSYLYNHDKTSNVKLVLDNDRSFITDDVHIYTGFTGLDNSLISNQSYISTVNKYTPYNQVTYEIPNLKAAKFKVEPTDTTFFKRNEKQLCDKTDLITGKFAMYNTGSLVANKDWSVTQLISLEPNWRGKTIYFNMSTTHFCFYDENKIFIPTDRSGTNVTVSTIPSNAAYVRFSIPNAEIRDWSASLVKGQFDIYGSILNIDNKYISLSKNELIIGKNGDFTDFVEGMDYAFNNMSNADIYITDSYTLDPTTIIQTHRSGIKIGKGNRYHFNPNATIKCFFPKDYANDQDMFDFAVFVAYKTYGSFMLDGARIECGNVRYAVHDERGGKYSELERNNEQISHYRNCYMTKLDTNPKTRTPQVLGCGTGANTKVIVENCYFESGMEGSSSYRPELTWHGNFESTQTNGANTVIISNTYCKHGIELLSPTPEVNGNLAIVNSSHGTIQVKAQPGYGEPNWMLKQWNNTQ